MKFLTIITYLMNNILKFEKIISYGYIVNAEFDQYRLNFKFKIKNEILNHNHLFDE